jgi:hypothetical protein
MIMIGADSHKRSHTVVALNEVGRRLGQKTVSTDIDGHLALLQWSGQFDDVHFALEDCRHLTRRLEGDLLAAGQRVVRVPTRLMADARRAGRDRGKSDPIDAEAVALAALRHPDLPVASLDGASGKSSCCRTSVGTWCGREPKYATRFAGTFTSWIRRCKSPPGGFAAAVWSTGSPASWTASMVS